MSCLDRFYHYLCLFLCLVVTSHEKKQLRNLLIRNLYYNLWIFEVVVFFFFFYISHLYMI